MSHFAVNLSYENWDNIFVEEDVNTAFNNYLNTYLRIFNSSFLYGKYTVHIITTLDYNRNKNLMPA